MLGTLVNVVAVLIGSVLGAYIIPKFPPRYAETVTAGVALSILLIGINMGMTTHNPLVSILSLAVGGIIGEGLGLQALLDRLGDQLKQWGRLEGSQAGEGAVTATLLFCVGPMAIMGPLQGGLLGDHSTLFAKSMLDGITSVVLSTTMGVGVIFSAVPLLIYQGAIALAAHQLSALLTPEMIDHLTAVGGLVILAMALNMLRVTRIRIANLLPAIFVAPLFYVLVSFLPI